tara:strand:+ start:67 stop:249 length:183 start_codon:yes stop_codon:yes gene_type:complete
MGLPLKLLVKIDLSNYADYCYLILLLFTSTALNIVSFTVLTEKPTYSCRRFSINKIGLKE